MIRDTLKKAFGWSDYDGNPAANNDTVKGFIESIVRVFYESSVTFKALRVKLSALLLWTAIQNKSMSEDMMQAFAEQIGFTAWEYVGKFNLVAPGNTVQKRKAIMLKALVEIMRKKGLAYSIQKGLTAFGFTSVIVTENVSIPIIYDGTFNYDGKADYSGNLEHQLFNIELTSTVDLLAVGAPDEQLDAIVAVANALKKERVELYQVKVRSPGFPAGQTRTIYSFS
jgi:hypothetical protein